MKKLICIIIIVVLLLCVSPVALASVQTETESESIPVLHINLETQEETLFYFQKVSSSSDRSRRTRASFANTPVSQSAGDGPTLRNIIDPDGRVRVTNTTIGPYYGIAYVHTRFSDGEATPGTGFLVNKNVVLTAAHCVHDWQKPYLERTVTVYLGRNGNTYTLSATASDVYLFGYDGMNSEADYAILVLNQNLGNTCGWLGLYVAPNRTLRNLSIITAGYPTDKDPENNGPTMWEATGTILSVDTNEFAHNADTVTGQSGSPIYYYNSTYGYTAVGIHTAGGNSQNYARRITDDIFDFLETNGLLD